jgi:hypothetical protein
MILVLTEKSRFSGKIRDCFGNSARLLRSHWRPNRGNRVHAERIVTMFAEELFPPSFLGLTAICIQDYSHIPAKFRLPD